jgi:hypothetical protein
MKRLTRLGFAFLLAAVAFVPRTSEAACTLQQCMDLMSNMDCSQYVCPQGQVAIPRCNAIYCYAYCVCRSFG